MDSICLLLINCKRSGFSCLQQDEMLNIFLWRIICYIMSIYVKEVLLLPEIARFYGIIIKMFFKPKEHEPSHVHALYGEYVGTFNIITGEMIEGDLPLKAQNLVREWLSLYSSELQRMWKDQVITKLPPLV